MEDYLKGLSLDAKEEAKHYVADKEIAQLFQSITAGLLHHRPEDPVKFVQDCLDSLKHNVHSSICWNTFIEWNPAANPNKGAKMSRENSPFVQDHKVPDMPTPKHKIEQSLNKGYKEYSETREGYDGFTEDIKNKEEQPTET